MRDFQEIKTHKHAVRVHVDPEPDREARPALWPTVGEYPIYDQFLYKTMTTDDERNRRFRAALAKLAPGRRVLDIGTGEDLLWARESVQAGARNALAVEVIEDAFHTAAGNLAALDQRDRITLLRGESTTLQFAPKADVCIAEIIGSLAGAEGAAAVLTDARDRHLVPGGLVVPHRAATLAAAVCLADLLPGRPVAFAEEALPYLQSIFDWHGRPFDIRLRVENPHADALLSDGRPVEVLEFNGDLRTEQRTTTRLAITRPGHVDGVLTWLNLWCLPDEAPLDALRMTTNWATIYFPLFDEPVPVAPGDVLDLTVTATLSDDGIHPDYHLGATLQTADRGECHGSLASPHHGGAFRAHPIYQALFPAA
ncbi:class I SAM-dependent methyltransferase [Streptomyces sp. NBC_00825]|uniref:class I SAM-dependent methyltransferase n=1 Tax=unclassified Streptomyces TaxID=2593676 RepID=UPI002ED69FC4|nr:class I SAM-dependent methyltransferase [Streptomyces sp. NBC_00826]WTH89048.1 class I SAM-dependent methyltransferase [Streptomyces sp. NBC_00825]WTH97778.1 class I SAM-dependent methyltransferase [Streptomyces sp. NBC_00822]